MRSSTNITSGTYQIRMNQCKSKPIAACTVYRRQVYWPASFCKIYPTREAADRASWSPFLGTRWRSVQFTLVVDDFGVNYFGEEHTLHLKHTIKENYTVTSEWDGRRYIGITLNWDYKKRKVHISMPQYVTKALKQFNHKLQKKHHQPYPSTLIIDGAKNQYANPQSTAPLLDRKGNKFIYQVCGKFLFLG